ncbi:universal stress protein [Salinirubellus salinus]|uniref:Universal stress protein n=1 Tax=Salinirubellus salinus TaxID=1364945 RepID=A0A9E7R5L9_9EURY|nr:universal stress protein [Salinirubellus salinus]UWM56346.1 universal stress protein [Salinirubellus salinus]
MFETILVAVDGSERAERAADLAVGLGAEHGATVHGVYVVDTGLLGEPALSSAELSVDAVEDFGHEVLDDVASTAAERDVEFVTRVCHGIPKEEILDYAEEIDADLVVVGAFGNNPGHRTGSVAEHVVKNAPRRVLKV